MILYEYEELESTNITAKEFLDNSIEMFAVSAKIQTVGQGRNNKSWLGSQGNIYLSIGFNHKNPIDVEDAIIIQGIGCLAVKKSLIEITKVNDYFIKYPNDVIAKNQKKYKKISGVIVNNGFIGDKCNFSILGIGVNVNQVDFPEEIKEIAISIKQMGLEIDREEFLKLIITNVEKYYYLGFNAIYNEWKKELNIVDKIIQVIGSNNDFKVKDFLKDGRLLVENQSDKSLKFIDNGDSIRYKYE